LRRQLIAIAEQLLALESKGQQQGGETAALSDALATGIDLARGLQSATTFSAETRNQIENRLAEGLALFADVRTRAAGQARLDGLGEYRKVLARVGRLQIPPELMNQFSPALAWAQDNVEQ